jgi:hypothetical protein
MMTQARRWQIPLAVVLAIYAGCLFMQRLPVEDGERDWFASLFPRSWMAWTFPTALFFSTIFLLLALMAVWEYASPGGQSACRHPALRDDAGRPPFHFAARQRLHPSRLAGADRAQPVVGSRSLGGLRHRRISLRVAGKLRSGACLRRSGSH